MVTLRLTVRGITVSRKLTVVQNAEKTAFWKSNRKRPSETLWLAIPLLRLTMRFELDQLNSLTHYSLLSLPVSLRVLGAYPWLNLGTILPE